MSITNRLRFAFNMKDADVSTLESEWKKMLGGVKPPSDDEATANKEIVDGFNLRIVSGFPLMGLLQEELSSSGEFPKVDQIYDFAQECVRRDKNGLDPKASPWRGDSHEVEADELLCEAISIVKKENRFGDAAVKGFITAFHRDYDDASANADDILNARRAAAINFAMTWVNDCLDDIEASDRYADQVSLLHRRKRAQARHKQLFISGGEASFVERMGESFGRGVSTQLQPQLELGMEIVDKMASGKAKLPEKV